MNPEPSETERALTGWRRYPRSCYHCRHIYHTTSADRLINPTAVNNYCTIHDFGTVANASCNHWKERE